MLCNTYTTCLAMSVLCSVSASGAAHSLTQPTPDLRCTTNVEQTLGLSKRNVQMLFLLVVNLKLSHTQASKCRMTSYNDPTPPCYFFEIISQPVAQKKPPQAVRRGGHQTYIMQKICSVFFPTAFRSSDRRWYSGFLVREQGNNFFNIYRGDHDFRVVGAPQPFIYTTHVNVHNHTERGGSSEVERGILAKTKEVSQLKSVCWLSFTH